MVIFKRLPYLLLLTITTFFVAENAFSQIEFIENKGQWNSEVKFMSLAGSGAFYLQQNGFTVAQHNPDDIENIKERMHGQIAGTALKQGTGTKVHSHAYTVKFLNAQNPQILPDKPIPSVNNYFIGNDKSKWASGCRIFKGNHV